MRVDPYLFFAGDCEEAFRFYERVTGGKVEVLMLFEGSPAAEHAPAEWGKKILHGSMRIGNTTLLACDAPPGEYSKPQGFSICLSLDSVEETERVFHALADNGQVQMPLQETFWALRFGMFVDRFGIAWMVNCDRPA
jgi:PhnB protein